jgi:hypothetical protein
VVTVSPNVPCTIQMVRWAPDAGPKTRRYRGEGACRERMRAIANVPRAQGTDDEWKWKRTGFGYDPRSMRRVINRSSV